MAWNSSFYKKPRNDAVAAVRAALIPLLLEDAKEPDREGRGSCDVWLIPATKADAALTLDDLARAAVKAMCA